MPENVNCPHCQRILQMGEEFRVQEVQCPECKETFVPGSPTAITSQPPPLSGAASAALQPGSPPTTASRREGDFEDDAEVDVQRIRSQSEFRPASGLAFAVKVLLGLNILVGLATLGSDYTQYQVANRLVARERIMEAELVASDSRHQAIGLVHFFVFIATSIIFIVWFRRAYANLTPLGADSLTYTTGSAVACWFIPFLNLVRPVQIAQEIWRKTDPDSIRHPGSAAPASSGLLGAWWAMWIISNVISNVTARMAWSVNSPESLQTAAAGGMISEIVSIPAALLAIAVVSTLDSRQTARWDALQSARNLSASFGD